MTAIPRAFLLMATGVVLGVAVCAVVVWNPAEWDWVHSLQERVMPTVVPSQKETEPGDQQLWTCGMHPQVIEKEPGSCPICRMDLVPVKASARGRTDSPAAQGQRKILHWRAPMDPDYIRDQPGKSPMGMDLVPVYEEEASAEGGVRVSPTFLQNFAVRTTEVKRGSMAVEIRTVGILAHNEERVYSVNTKFEGWIEKARFNNVGEQVKKGEVLFEIYSPQLLTTQQEYLAAMDYVRRLTDSQAYPDAIERAKSLLKSARERLRHWDISEEQIQTLERTKQVGRTVAFVSPNSGFVVAKMGDSLEGMKLNPGMTVLKLADHSTLWAEVQFFERHLRHLREGQRVTVEIDAFPGRRWSGKILFFRPAVNPQTRTLTAFVEVANSNLQLRPQMYANISVRVPGASNAVMVPDEAVLHSGARAVVIVAKEGNRFEPREVDLGMTSEGMQEVLHGLTAGEEVVTSSQFLIDSESNLKAAISQLLGDQMGEEQSSTPSPMTHQH